MDLLSAPRRPRRVVRVVCWLAAIYAVWCGTLFFLQSSMLYLPAVAGPGMSEEKSAALAGVDRLWVPHADGVKTEAWLLRTKQVPARGLVCFLHGNAELIDHALAEARAWNARGMDVVLPEYRGYGRTPGSPAQAAIVQDVTDAIDAALVATGGASLVLHGRSLGSGVAVQVAARRGAELTALVLESPFMSVAAFAWRYGVPPFIVTNPYRSDRVIPTLACPMLVLHSTS
ncbi:MAG: alpha/beta fold hydrolase, partial [Phycisphaerae bacterium]|nr:alpha/beta fold hydrolase [Phycisphaerae bacterium]